MDQLIDFSIDQSNSIKSALIVTLSRADANALLLERAVHLNTNIQILDQQS